MQRKSDKLKIDGLPFLLKSSFHDARLVEGRRGEKFGKDALTLLVDFKTAEVPPPGGNRCEINFLNCKFPLAPEQELLFQALQKRDKNRYLLSHDCAPSDLSYHACIRFEFFLGGEPRRELLEFDFSDAKAVLSCPK